LVKSESNQFQFFSVINIAKNINKISDIELTRMSLTTHHPRVL